MGDLAQHEPTLASCEQYRTLLAVAEAIVCHRDLRALFHDLAGRLHRVVRFDYLVLVLHDAGTNTMRIHVLETSEPTSPQPGISIPVQQSPAGLVWQTQQPLIIPNTGQEAPRARPWGPKDRP